MIANEVAERLSGSKVFAEVTAVAPGFLNCKVKESFITEYLSGMRTADKFGMEMPENPKKDENDDLTVKQLLLSADMLYEKAKTAMQVGRIGDAENMLSDALEIKHAAFSLLCFVSSNLTLPYIYSFVI